MASSKIPQTMDNYNQMDEKKLVTCCWNSGHRLAHSKYQRHQLYCPDRPSKVFKCSFSSMHEFRTLEACKKHELQCPEMARQLRDRAEEEANSRARGGFKSAPIIVERIKDGESTDEWADEGAAAGVTNFKAPGLGVTWNDIETFIANYTGDEPVCEYLLVAMSPEQKSRAYEIQRLRTIERAGERQKEEERKKMRQPITKIAINFNEDDDEHSSNSTTSPQDIIGQDIIAVGEVSDKISQSLTIGRGRPITGSSTQAPKLNSKNGIEEEWTQVGRGRRRK